MADIPDACIVCLGDLRIKEPSVDDVTPKPIIEEAPSLLHKIKTTRSSSKQTHDPENIAHLLPCKHELHDACLKPWVERANSCPICRATFNEVEIKAYVNGPILSTYGVNDKQQIPDVDVVEMLDEVEDDLFEEDGACIICGAVNNGYELMWCDGCDRPAHVFCASGSQEAQDLYYCHDCVHRLDAGGVLPMAGGSEHHNTRSRRSMDTRRIARRHQRQPNSDWARVWQSVWDNLNLDLDFPFDEEPAEARRTPAQRRDFAAWQRRLRVANHQGAANRFRAAAPAVLREPPAPETQEENQAWNAFEKAREANGDIQSDNLKRKATEPPMSPREGESTSQPKLKRPRTAAVRNSTVAGASRQSRDPSRPALEPRARGGPGFLASLLQEVERRGPGSDPASPTATSVDDQASPLPVSSPGFSPITSEQGSRREGSMSPQPLDLPDTVLAESSPRCAPSRHQSPAAFSPFSPIGNHEGPQHNTRGRRVHSRASHARDSSPLSPSRSLSLSTKAEIQRMVKSALGSRYKNGDISKDDYTNINRDVSRSLYEQVQDANDLADHEARERLQALAMSQVQSMIDALQS